MTNAEYTGGAGKSFFRLPARITLLDYSSLSNFIHKRMKMTHIYQPLMLRTLLESKDGRATTEQIARSFLNEDAAQLQYYKKIVRRWPHQTLRKHGIVEYDSGTYTLRLDTPITDAQRHSLMELCDLRLQEFIDRDPWIRKFRELDERSISGSLRYDVLSRSKGVCVACGARSTEASLHVDHIVPRSRGGRTEPDNLQALCYRCNTEKRNRDDTDFVRWHKTLQFRDPKCRLCKKPHDILLENSMAYAVREEGGAGMGFLVATNRHVCSFVDLLPVERQLCMALIDQVIADAGLGGPAGGRGLDVHGFDRPYGEHCHISISAP